MNLRCVNCGEPIPAKNINIQKTLALCDHCETVFDFSENVASKFSTQKPKNRKIKQPVDVLINEDNEQLDLRFKWSLKIVPPTINILMGLWFLVGFIFPMLAVVNGNGETLGIGLLLGAFPSYYFISLLLNRTQLGLNDTVLSTASKPLPWFDGKNINVDLINTVSYKQSKSFESYFDLTAQLHDGREINLIELIPYEHAVFIAHEVNAYLYALDGHDEPDFEHLTDSLDLHHELNMDHSEQAVKHE
jgi:hypothetical protein